ncbi:A/G-specific adenine glycosylase [Virgibacillus halotolerans]|uniref:A/G-specific adenine glycosylase n=1 Tax=Virgibacillus halotolerans TaxID=1071053 RepID=UPI001960640D|nr:A/G-specific adenine glycosylase [Virgibacillus halotolerans]MBM7601942.1 A/G-specific adenine glycosylase [Virgibacillus halotolerans]
MIEKTLQHFNIDGFQQDLLTWYQANKRDLPWRADQDPYRVWVSEIMLQQTKVDTVIPYFQRFIDKYPTVYELADADPQDVLKAWEGLGYYSRARNLQNAVKEVVATYGGKVPKDREELGALKGIGPYTRGAILSIAYDQPEPAVDGNVMRVISRVLKIEENIAEQRVKKLFEAYVREIISVNDPASFNQALMELGALVCTPKSPDCPVCPIKEHCTAYREGIQQELPIKTKAKKQKRIPYAVLLIKNQKEEYLIEKRPDSGLLANLWHFPMVPLEEVEFDEIANWIFREYGIRVTLHDKLGELKHVFTHLIWQLDIYNAETDDSNIKHSELIFEEKRNLKAYPFPVSHLKMMKYL